MEAVINLVICGLLAGMTYALASEGLWGACLMFFNVLFAGLIAFNFYEPLATLLDGTGIGWGYSDTLCLMAVFGVSLVLLRLTTESLAPGMVRFPNAVFHLGRWVFAFLTSAITMGILILGFETAPVHKKVFGVIDYKSRPPFNMGLDRVWLGLFQYTTGQVLASYDPSLKDPFGEYRNANVFDARSQWLLIHQQARPYGTESILEEEGAAGAGGAAPAAGGAAPAGAAGAGGPTVVAPGPGGGVVIPN